MKLNYLPDKGVMLTKQCSAWLENPRGPLLDFQNAVTATDMFAGGRAHVRCTQVVTNKPRTLADDFAFKAFATGNMRFC